MLQDVLSCTVLLRQMVDNSKNVTTFPDIILQIIICTCRRKEISFINIICSLAMQVS